MTDRLLFPAHQVHDELIYVVPEHLAEKVRDIVVHEMAQPPRWLPNAPLAAEGHIGGTYGDAK
jgi:DNA polymerase I-like protein with 3'-5' exonuclease and polymerase domains